MGSITEIAWCDATFNPWHGCVKISPECTNCYAEAFSKRTGHNVWGLTAERRFFGDKHWSEPLKWNREAEAAGERRRVFCASMADWLEDRHDLDFPRLMLFDLIRRTPQLDWLLLSKRLANFQTLVSRAMMTVPGNRTDFDDTIMWLGEWICDRPPHNVWIGTTIGHADRVDEITHLRAVPAAVRFISGEPLLGRYGHSDGSLTFLVDSGIGMINALAGLAPGEVSEVGSPKIDWLILGGESGPHARPCDAALLRAVMREARQAGTAVFVKQLGARFVDEENGVAGRSVKLPSVREVGRIRVLRDPKGGDMEEWPADLRVREFPSVESEARR